MFLRKFVPAFLVALALLVVWEAVHSPSIVVADTLTGEIRGTVLDVGGLVPLVGAEMTLINVDRGWEKKLTTDANGGFAFLQLEPGNYTIIALIDGYYRQEKTGILVRLNRPKVVLPPFQLRREVTTPTQQITLQGEQTRTAIVDLTATGPNPVVLAYLSEPGTTSLVSLLDWAVRNNFDRTVLDALPLRNVRSFDQLALLTAGVTRVPFSSGTGPAVGIGVGTAGQFSVNGMRGRSNNFTVDGSDNNDEDIGVRRQGFVSLVPQTNESVTEFEITTAGFSAEFGRNAGGMVNAVSRSGTSDVHGQLYGIFGHDALQAGEYFENTFSDSVNSGDLAGGSFEGKDASQQLLGGTVGAPLVEGKLFFFGSLEYQRIRQQRQGHFVVPTADERGLRLNPEISGGFVPIDELGDFFEDRGILHSSLAGEGVFSLYPLPNNSGGPFGDHTYSQVRPQEGNGLVFSTKFDWYISDVHSFTGRYNYTDDDSLIPFTGQGLNSSLGTDTRTQNVSLFLNSTTAHWGNALRLSYGRTRLAFPSDRGDTLVFGSDVPSPLPPAIENVPGLGQTIETPYGRFGPFGTTGPMGRLEISPYSPIGIDVFNFPQGRTNNTYQISDFLTLNRSAHTLKFGFDIRRSQLNSFADRNSRPFILFGPGFPDSNCQANPTCLFNVDDDILRGTDFASLGVPAGSLHTLSTQSIPDTTIGLEFTQYDFFVQDSWRVTSRLNLSLGLRYEYQTVPREKNRKIESTFGLVPDDFARFDPGSPPNGAIFAGNLAFDRALEAQQAYLGGRTEIYDPDKNNFGPRIGFAWDPWGNGRTVIRGGYGIAYDATLGAVTSQSRNVFPTFVPLNLDPNFVSGVPAGFLVPNTTFFEFTPTGDPLVQPGSLNTYGLPPEGFATGIGALFLQTVLGSGLRVNGLAFTLPERDLKSTYAQQFVFSLQHQWTGDLVTSAEYVRNRGLNLTRFTTPNAGAVSTPLLLSNSRFPVRVLAFSPGIPAGTGVRPTEDLGAFTIFENQAQSDYHSLQLRVERRFSNNLDFRTSYTWSHVIDEVSDPFDGRGFFALPQVTPRPRLERASANFDSRHRLSFHLIWQTPELSSPWLRDWQFAAIGEFQSGQPYTVNTSLDRNGDGNLTDRLDTTQGLVVEPNSPTGIRVPSSIDPLDLIAPQRAAGRVGRNTFLGDGLGLFDLAVSRFFPVSEQSRFEIRAEVFNLFNRTTFGTPVRILESPGFGSSYDTQTPARSMRLAIRYVF